jgi:hypothetical protein
MANSKKRTDNRVNLKLDPQLGDELDYLQKITGKSKLLILHELLDSMVLCASAYQNFIYHVNVHTPQSIEILFYGKPNLISGSFKVTDESQVKEFEKDVLAKAEPTVQKGMSFNNIANRMSKRAKIIKRCS